MSSKAFTMGCWKDRLSRILDYISGSNFGLCSVLYPLKTRSFWSSSCSSWKLRTMPQSSSSGFFYIKSASKPYVSIPKASCILPRTSISIVASQLTPHLVSPELLPPPLTHSLSSSFLRKYLYPFWSLIFLSYFFYCVLG